MSHDFLELLVDSGNSRLKWGILRQGRLTPGPPLATAGRITETDLARLWGDLSATPRRVWIANVAGEQVAACLRAFVRARWQMEPEFVRPQAAGFGVINGYLRPETLGVDRWLALIAVRNRYALPACIADCGTALTVDLIDGSGRHLGGLICPGLKLMAEALTQKTAAVRLGAWSGQTEALGDHTVAAVHLGARQAALGLIERTFWQQQKHHPKLCLILTGGDAAELCPKLKVPAQLVPDLVLEGLAVISRG
ncbi:MAG: type III pantothenate kinase [Methylohalobius sp.]